MGLDRIWMPEWYNRTDRDSFERRSTVAVESMKEELARFIDTSFPYLALLKIVVFFSAKFRETRFFPMSNNGISFILIK